MEIISLELSGFKNYEEKTQFNFLDQHNELIFDLNGSAKSFLFESILGIIFGFTSNEKVNFRGNPQLNKTYTGMLTLALDQRTMIIERDFETDFVACLLSDTKTTRSIFQGKDFADNGYARPYLQMLRSVFPIIDKELFIEICYDLATKDNSNFSDLLKVLYSLLTPQFKFSNVKYLVNEGQILEENCLKTKDSENQLNKFESLHKAVRHMIKLKETEDLLENDSERLMHLIKRMQSRYDINQKAETKIQKEYTGLIKYNPLQLRADLLIWKNLIEVNKKNEQKLRDFKLRKEHINNILNHDLYEYTKQPETFSRDAARFKERSLQLSYSKQAFKDYESMIENMKQTLDARKKSWRALITLTPVVVFVASLIFLGPQWVFIIPETLLAFFIVLAFSGHARYKKKNQIYHFTEETHILQKKIRESQEELSHLLKKSAFFKEPQYLDSHLQRYNKCKQFQRELRSIEREENKLREVMASESYQNQLTTFEEKYTNIIDIERRDLETYLDNYVETRQELESKQKKVEFYPAVGELEKLHKAHLQGIKELSTARTHMVKTLKIENGTTDLNEILDKLDRKIKNVKLQKNMDAFTALHH